ncbi:MAG: 3-hydroxyacyl-[acyl-carrier-protein] dehydratase [Patiriisocius sp.]|jgi:predicted hotdog family 3-hydroxylacyl-ACP dehydratase
MSLLPDKITDKATIEGLIPQKKPFVMVDALLAFTSDTITAGLTISEDNLFTDDGFFREPGIIEHMAQSVALHTGYDFFLKKEQAPTGYIGAIKKISVTKLPKIDDSLETTVQIIQEFMGITLVEINTYCNGELIASGEMKTALA